MFFFRGAVEIRIAILKISEHGNVFQFISSFSRMRVLWIFLSLILSHRQRTGGHSSCSFGVTELDVIFFYVALDSMNEINKKKTIGKLWSDLL